MTDKKIVLLGSTGSLGTQSLEVIKQAGNIKVTALAARESIDLLERQIREFTPEIAAVFNEHAALELKHRLAESGIKHTEILAGESGLLAAAAHDCDLAINCLVGAAGLLPTMTAINAGRDVALANKESLVAAGALVMDAAKKNGVNIIPVDGEHSAIFKCLQGNEGNTIEKIHLTASGGPFRGWTSTQLEAVTPVQALAHPVWNMGSRITIDCATMMNKGFEAIEAVWLFDVPLSKVNVLVHPQGIIHSMVEFLDGCIMAQLSAPDMRLPVQYAIDYPLRRAGLVKKADFSQIRELNFEPPNTDTFPCLRLAYDAHKMGGAAAAVLNAADEEAVQLFLSGAIKFTDIPRIIESTLSAYNVQDADSVDVVLEADRWARRHVLQSFRK